MKGGKVRYIGASSMMAWEFSKALHLQKQNGWARFVSMQDNYNLLAREEEREMLPLCADEGIQTMVYSPLASGRLARPWGASSARAEADGQQQDEFTADSDRRIIEAVSAVAAERGVSQAQIGLAWLRRHPVVATPIIGPLKTKHIDEAIAALSITLTEDEAKRLEKPYTPRRDFQGIADAAVHTQAAETATGFKASVLA